MTHHKKSFPYFLTLLPGILLSFTLEGGSHAYPYAVWIERTTIDTSKFADLDDDFDLDERCPTDICQCVNVDGAAYKIGARLTGKQFGDILKTQDKKGRKHWTYVGVGSGLMGGDLMFLEEMIESLDSVRHLECIHLSVILIDKNYNINPPMAYQKYQVMSDPNSDQKTYSYKDELFPYVAKKIASFATESQKISSLEIVLYNHIDAYHMDMERGKAPRPSVITAVDVWGLDIQKIEDEIERPGIVVQIDSRGSRPEFTKSPYSDLAKYFRVETLS